MRRHQQNLVVEIAALILYVGALFFVAAAAVVLLTIFGAEFFQAAGEVDFSEFEKRLFSLEGYLVVFSIYSIPLILTSFAILGLRLLFVRPEPRIDANAKKDPRR